MCFYTYTAQMHNEQLRAKKLYIDMMSGDYIQSEMYLEVRFESNSRENLQIFHSYLSVIAKLLKSQFKTLH